MSFPPLSPITRKLFHLPDYAQRENNICSMVNFFPEAKQLLDAVGIERIVEIGSEAGLNTAVLLDYVKQRRKELITVDPAPVPFPFSPSAEPAFSFCQETSAEFLKRGVPAEVIFMDGDHNYETVLADLKTIHEKRKTNGIKILFLHDVSWPWARQDIYYDPSRIVHPHPYHAENRVSPYAGENMPSLSPANYMTADHAGGAENGVLTAVEDFLSLCGASWHFQRIPVLYGIGILISLENTTGGEQQKLLPLVEELASHCELLSILELNRIENLCRHDTLLQELKKAGEVWRDDQNYIRQANELLHSFSSEINTLQQELNKTGEVWRNDQSYIRQANELLHDFSSEINTWKEKMERLQQDLQTAEKQCGELQKEEQALLFCRKQLEEELRNGQQKLNAVLQTQQNMQKELDSCRDLLWNKDRELRQQQLELPAESWRTQQGFFSSRLPYRRRNAGKLKKIQKALSDGTVKLLSLDLFDTLLLREFQPELKRFAGTARILHDRCPEISVTQFYHARALAHQMAYRTSPVTEGCREASAGNIFRIMMKILGLPEHLLPVLMNAELDYEKAHLHLNKSIWRIVLLAREQNIPVIAVSDMYWGGRELKTILEQLLPEPEAVQKIYSSSDYGVSKLSGLLFDRVVHGEGVASPSILHIGDNRQSDFSVPFVRNGIQAFWLPRSACYTSYCSSMQKHQLIKLHKRNILHGLR